MQNNCDYSRLSLILVVQIALQYNQNLASVCKHLRQPLYFYLNSITDPLSNVSIKNKAKTRHICMVQITIRTLNKSLILLQLLFIQKQNQFDTNTGNAGGKKCVLRSRCLLFILLKTYFLHLRLPAFSSASDFFFFSGDYSYSFHFDCEELYLQLLVLMPG